MNQNNISFEAVIKGLECRLDINGSKYKHCLTCDYRHDIDHCQWACQIDGILEDALTLLKAQEPRLLTVDDFKNNSDVDICGYLPCWVEPNPYNDAATEKPGWGLVSVGQIGGVYHRYWTGKPTQEQMEAMKWG